METLREQIVYHYEKKLAPYRLELNHTQAILIQQIRKFALVLKEDYNSDGIILSLRLSSEAKAKLEALLNQTLNHTPK